MCRPTTDWRLDIYGDGPCKVRWQRLAIKLGIESRCHWHGQVARDEALAGLRSAHLFVTTSLKDLTSTVILEALGSGVPVICPDHCGFADVVNEQCGIKIPIGNVREFETGLSRAISRDRARRNDAPPPRRGCIAQGTRLFLGSESGSNRSGLLPRASRRM